MNEGFSIFIFALLGGLGMIASGVWSQLGHSRGMYLFKGYLGHPSGYVYGSYPVGIAFLLIAFAVFVPDRTLAGRIAGYSSLTALIISIILMIWQPRWLKPWWLKWLEDHYSGAVLEVILEEARQSKNFEGQTPDEASLAAWVHTVLEKYKSQS